MCLYQGLDSDLDSEVSSLLSYDREVNNLHLVSPLEYAALLKQVCEGREGKLINTWKPNKWIESFLLARADNFIYLYFVYGLISSPSLFEGGKFGGFFWREIDLCVNT